MPQPIPSNSFYSGTVFKPPALIPGVGNKVALRAARTDPARLLRTFPTQQAAVDYCDANAGRGMQLWSFEVDGTGRRRYTAASYDAFWRFYSRHIRRGTRLHFYEVVRERHACKLYFDLEFLWAHNARARAEDMVDALVAACGELAGGAGGRAGGVVELDSTTERKFSRHVIFQDIAFHDNGQAGEFARRAVEAVAARDEGLVMVRTGDGGRAPFVDMGVYTRNRCFRLVGSCKFGKSARLVPKGSGGRVAFSRELFVRSLVCSVRRGVPLRGTRYPAGAAGGPGTGLGRAAGAGGGAGRTRGAGSPYAGLDAYVRGLVGPQGGGIYAVTVAAGGDTVVYALQGGYKFCANVGRHHKSNNVMLVADVGARRMYQKCFDPDCRGFRSAGWDVPAWAFAGGAAADDALVAMMDRLERAGGAGGALDADVTDEALGAMMDELAGGTRAR